MPCARHDTCARHRSKLSGTAARGANARSFYAAL
ncbi:hypothetical protein BURPS406E_B1053 [Burkholderia pseudomallei 406e]|uniref:Uncharacterized protein n=1 Tax=Burkholderia pseudomallei (strain 1710b) TaxID=320372 RepID=Q3JVR6_BURP1|nr:hypothetical protein BURPS1710b_0924 [Burkholderia pseudomallei 1710b]AFR14634.1 hypothetical protein BPC006_I0746 [Burkholderia pseudomallei BPC006]EDO83460.1 hypothetical protein BURPS406E_B1053 [Burkholderia pseudomallei 406e]EDO90989.1 hypothetical protein BURPSPAST_Z0197 [Burkholderia pseudomallei Pasteur 52237]EDS86364.1 hypothetical protein BURPSS13_I0391 [Burkholderia pseudomallei S13]EDU09291.1 hypothetical protein BURPS1655_K0629 [Burkholderia pseudomallei 1655]